MKSIFAVCLLVPLALSLSTTTYGVQLFTYDNEGEVAGAAVMILHSKGVIVDRAISHCLDLGALDERRARKITDNWSKRNSAYLSLAPILLEEMHQAYLDAGQASSWEENRTSTMPKQIDAISSALINQIETLPNIDQKKTMCVLIVNAVDKGKLDFANEDPVIVEYLNRRIMTTL